MDIRVDEVRNVFFHLFFFDISESISIESNIATAFNLRTYSEVVMQTVHPASVALDSVEITFKDQYMGRSEMWRLKTYLVRMMIISFGWHNIACKSVQRYSKSVQRDCSPLWMAKFFVSNQTKLPSNKYVYGDVE